MNENNFNNIQDFENNYELRKALNKLENELQKKSYELSAITNLYQDLKSLNERINKECDDLNNKYNSVRNEMNIMEKKYQNEIDTIKSEHKKQIEIYDNKILKLSEYNPDNLRKNIEIEMENKFKQKLANKDREIDELSQELNKSRQSNEILATEYETYKSDITNEMNTLKQFHQNEVNNLLEKIRLSENLKNLDSSEENQSDTIIGLKNELDSTRKQISELTNEIDKLRHDKELLTIEKNEHKLNLLKMTDSQNFTQKKLEADLNNAQNTIVNLQKEISILNDNAKNRDFQINDLLKQKDILNDKLNNNLLEFQETKNIINNLKNIVKSHEEEAQNNLIENEKTNKEMIMQERKEKENYLKQIEDLKMKLKEGKSYDIIQKEEEIDKLKEEIRLYKKGAQYDSNSKSIKELLNKLKVMTEKKNEYKLQCKIANENMELIIKKLNKQQQIEFENIIKNTKNKYYKNNMQISGTD